MTSGEICDDHQHELTVRCHGTLRRRSQRSWWQWVSLSPRKAAHRSPSHGHGVRALDSERVGEDGLEGVVYGGVQHRLST